MPADSKSPSPWSKLPPEPPPMTSETVLGLVTYRDPESGCLWLTICELPEPEDQRRSYARWLVAKEFPDRSSYDSVHAARVGEFVEIGKVR